MTKGSYLSTTINLNLEWTLPLEVHGNDSFSNLRFHFDLHMCHSLSIKKALLYRKVCNKTSCSPSPITFFSPIYKTISFWSFFSYENKKVVRKNYGSWWSEISRWDPSFVYSLCISHFLERNSSVWAIWAAQGRKSKQKFEYFLATFEDGFSNFLWAL